MRKKKHYFNENYWDVLTPENCYDLGMLYADGSVTSAAHGGERGKLDIQLSDKDWLEGYNARIGKNTPVQFRREAGSHVMRGKVANAGRVVNHKEQWRVCVYSHHAAARLVELGCGMGYGRKDHQIRFPNNASGIFIPSFMRGYLDGDGYCGRKNRDSCWRTSFAGNKWFLEGLAQHVADVFGWTAATVGRMRPTNTYQVQYYNGKAHALAHYMLSEPGPYMDRKLGRLLEWEKENGTRAVNPKLVQDKPEDTANRSRAYSQDSFREESPAYICKTGSE